MYGASRSTQDLSNHVGMGFFMDIRCHWREGEETVSRCRCAVGGRPNVRDLLIEEVGEGLSCETSGRMRGAISSPAQSFVNRTPKRRRISSSVNFRPPVASPFGSDESMHRSYRLHPLLTT